MKLGSWLAVGVVGIALVATFGCKRKSSTDASGAGHSEWKMNKVPLRLDIPAGWVKSANNSAWLAFKPAEGGAVVAFSDFQSNDEVDSKLGSALRELKLQNVVWKNPYQTTVNGLSARVAEGTCIDSGQKSHVKYALINAGNGSGHLLFIYDVWNTHAAQWDAVGDSVMNSIRRY